MATLNAVEETRKTCRDCGDAKPLEQFHRNSQTKDGRSVYCGPCAQIRARAYQERWTPEQRALHRERVLKWRYGIGVDLVIALYEQQEGCCAICRNPGARPATDQKRRGHAGVLCVDHDHDTGRIRGLLCTNCNVGIGRFGEDTDMLVRAANYLIENREA